MAGSIIIHGVEIREWARVRIKPLSPIKGNHELDEFEAMVATVSPSDGFFKVWPYNRPGGGEINDGKLWLRESDVEWIRMIEQEEQG